MSTKAEAEAKFRAVVAAKGGAVVGDHIRSQAKVRLRCGHGHEWEARPNSVANNGTWCPMCAGKTPELGEARLRSAAAEKGGTVLGNYFNSYTKIRLRCAEGHEWETRPTSIIQGAWCPTCHGKSPEVAEAKFRAVVSERGGEVVGDYVDTITKVRLRCSHGHDWDVVPRSVTSMGSWCPTCACGPRSKKVKGKTRKNRSKAEAEAAFREIVAAKGGEVVGKYVNMLTKVRLRCAEGHELEAKPTSIVHSGTWCPRCARQAHGAKVSRWRERRKASSSSPVAPLPAAYDISLAALVLTMSRVGVDRIDENNAKQAFSRIAIWQKIAGPVVLDGRKVVIDAEDVEKHVGLVLPGIEKLTADGFERRLGEIVAGA